MDLIKSIIENVQERDTILEQLAKEFDELTIINEADGAIDWVPPTEEEKSKFKIDPDSVRPQGQSAERQKRVAVRARMGDAVRVVKNGESVDFVIVDITEDGLIAGFSPKTKKRITIPMDKVKSSKTSPTMTRGKLLQAAGKKEKIEDSDAKAVLHIYNAD